ncbi:heterokaryon incompatibility protein-domain-containing protein [Echria macrotheca]|uniref:Heterokaryon incompatibility protein-domain-containing protein n=1 Tax=Echria macrotheca TaxID=438768 RepID=A0AAJ0BB01_9PEZI|nr:heterokaryon incompatibility protein-domain-containing protein [Echria macrotheca]
MVGYAPLNTAIAEIRLFVLFPGKDSEPIQGSLRNASLDGRPEFEALSYVWGERDSPRSITLDGEGFHVTPNLYAALCALRRPASSRTLWIDAICIDQHNVDEKNHQVPLMARIYKQASRVTAWLGPSTPRIELAISWLNSSPGPYLDPVAARYWLDLEKRAATSRQGELDRHFDIVKSFAGAIDISDLQYWHRMWTFQEFALPSEEPVCLCGALKFSASALSDTRISSEEAIDRLTISINFLYSVLGPEFTGLPTVPGFNNQALSGGRSGAELMEFRFLPQNFSMVNSTSRKSIINMDETALFLLLSATRGRGCGDSRDRFYALYAMAPEIQEYYPPDYAKPFERVCLETTAFLINIDAESLMFDSFGLRYDRLSSGAYPTWVPDFFQPVMPGMPTQRHYNLFVHHYGKAIPERLCDLEGRPDARVDDSLTTLTIYARNFGPVRTMKFANSSESVIAQVHAILRPGLPIPPWSWAASGEQLKAHALGLSWIAGVPLTDMDHFHDRLLRLIMAIDKTVDSSYPFHTVRAFFDNCLDVADSGDWLGTSFKERLGEQDSDMELVSSITGCASLLVGKTLLATQDWIMGIGMSDIEDGDILVLAPPLPLLLALREVPADADSEGDGTVGYKIAGTAYAYGLMDSYALDLELVEELAGREFQRFTIY